VSSRRQAASAVVARYGWDGRERSNASPFEETEMRGSGLVSFDCGSVFLGCFWHGRQKFQHPIVGERTTIN